MGKYCESYFPKCICNECIHKRKNPRCCIEHHKTCSDDERRIRASCKDFIGFKKKEG